MIQLPWIVPQQPLVKTEISAEINQQKIPLDLNVTSTDTTAISSFTLSVIIALILGGFATWLAYWYGRRSFDLTRQSFEAVIKQIESSEKAAQDLNTRIFEQQHVLQKAEFEFNKYQGWERDLRKLGIDYIHTIYQYIELAKRFQSEFIQLSWEDKIRNNRGSVECLSQLQESFQKIKLMMYQIALFFDTETTVDQSLYDLNIVFQMLATKLLEDYQKDLTTTEAIRNPKLLLNELNTYDMDLYLRLLTLFKFHQDVQNYDKSSINFIESLLIPEILNRLKDIVGRKAT